MRDDILTGPGSSAAIPVVRRCVGTSGPVRTALVVRQVAGNLSGHAIALAPTSSCHALSYPLTLRAGLAHGHACGVTFGRMLRSNADVSEAENLCA